MKIIPSFFIVLLFIAVFWGLSWWSPLGMLPGVLLAIVVMGACSYRFPKFEIATWYTATFIGTFFMAMLVQM